MLTSWKPGVVRATRNNQHSILLGALTLLLTTAIMPAAKTVAVGKPPTPPISEATRTKIITQIKPKDITTNDPAYPLVVMVDGLRTNVQTAIEVATAADLNAANATTAWQDALFNATVARVRADHAQRLVNRWAASMYRDETVDGGPIAVINTSLADPGRTLDVKIWFIQIAELKHQNALDATKLIKKADLSAANAEKQKQVAENAKTKAVDSRKRANETLTLAEATLDRVLGQTVSYQIMIGADGCPTEAPAGTLRGGAVGLDIATLCAKNVAAAPTPEAALAIKYAFRALGATYACNGLGRGRPFMYDCSSLVARAYAEGAGLDTARPGWIPTTRDLIPWNGGTLAPWAVKTEPTNALPGDMVLYDTHLVSIRHVVMLLADGLMLHIAACGDVANITTFWGFANTDAFEFLGVRHIEPDKARFDGSTSFTETGTEPWLSDGGSD